MEKKDSLKNFEQNPPFSLNDSDIEEPPLANVFQSKPVKGFLNQLCEGQINEKPAATITVEKEKPLNTQKLLSQIAMLLNGEESTDIFSDEVVEPPPVPKIEPPASPQPVQKIELPPVQEETPKRVNFHHGNQKPFSVSFHFGTNVTFTGYRRPETSFTTPSFCLSRPILSMAEKETRNELQGTEICSFQVQLYKVTKGQAEEKGRYVDNGVGKLVLQRINDNYFLTLLNGKEKVSLVLFKGIKPRVKTDCFVQICAGEMPDAKNYNIYLIRCGDANDATELFKVISDCVAK